VAIRVVVLNPRAVASDREKRLPAGCPGFETKPMNRERLLNKTESLFETTGDA